MDGRLDIWMKGWTYGWKARHMDGRLDIWMKGWTYEWKAGHMDERLDIRVMILAVCDTISKVSCFCFFFVTLIFAPLRKVMKQYHP